MQESGATGQRVELVPPVRAGGVEVHLLQEGDIGTGVPDECRHGAQGIFVMQFRVAAPAGIAFRSVPVCVRDIPSQDLEPHDILNSMKIIVVDCKYVEDEFAAAYLLIEDGRGFFIECNTNHAIPRLLDAARQEGLHPGQIEGLLITHVHLDHAGGAGLFLKTFPNAILYAHPRAARHAIDPSRLIDSATRVYGEAFMEKLYGTLLPCAAERVKELEDGALIPFGQKGLEIRHVLGHANHHVIAREPVSGTVFTGDAFGVSYPVLSGAAPVIIPSTSPTDFDGEEALKSIDLIESLRPTRVALTHFGFIEGERVAEAAGQLRKGIRISLDLLAQIRSGNLPAEKVEHELTTRTGAYLGRSDLDVLRIDLKVNAQGLVHAASKT